MCISRPERHSVKRQPPLFKKYTQFPITNLVYRLERFGLLGRGPFKILMELYKRIYSASGTHAAKVTILTRAPNSLVLTGRVFDRISRTSWLLRLSYPSLVALNFEDLLQSQAMWYNGET